MDGIGQEVGTDPEAIRETERRANKIVVRRLDETRTGAGEAGVVTTVEAAGAAVSRIDAEIDAERATQAQPRRAGLRVRDADPPWQISARSAQLTPQAPQWTTLVIKSAQ